MMPPLPIPHPTPNADLSSGGRLVRVAGATLPLREVRVSASARGGLARVVVEQHFHNAHSEPLDVTYMFPLPSDAAVSGYSFRVGERRIVGEIDKRAQARERFEQAIAQGKSAAILEQERTSLFTQELGNIPPGADVVAELEIDQPLRWLAEGAWEWRFPMASAPRYLGGPGRVPDAARVTHDVADALLRVRAAFELFVRDAMVDGCHPESPSHAMKASDEGAACAVRFSADDGTGLDRDVVVRWAVAVDKVGLSVDTTRPAGAAEDAYALVTVVPPARAAKAPRVPRDLIVLLDTSGSMSGAPLDQARRLAGSLVDTLVDADQLEMIEFSTAPRRWKRQAVPATSGNKRDAVGWLASLRASGGTEMLEGICEACRELRHESQRQVVLITDGLIGFESEVISSIASRLPPSSRLHTVGVGSAVNRSLTGAAARIGRGVEVVIGLGEDAEKATRRLVARTDAPLVVDLTLTGSALLQHAPARLPDLFAGAPLLVGSKLRADGGELVVRGRTAQGEWSERVVVPPIAEGSGHAGVRAVFAREQVEDLEMEVVRGGDRTALESSIERIGLQFRIATRFTSWVAVSDEVTVDPRDPTRRVRMPQNLPYGTSVEGLGLRAPSPQAQAMGAAGFAPAQAFSFRAAAGRPRSAPSSTPPMMRPMGVAAPGPSKPIEPPDPRAAEEKTRTSSIVDAVRGLFRSVDEDSEETEVSPAIPRRAALAGALTRERRIRGRITSRPVDELVIEFTVEDSELAWDPTVPPTLVLADGTRITASIAEDRSTRSMTVAPGVTVRFVVRLPTRDAVAIKEVVVPLAFCSLVVVL